MSETNYSIATQQLCARYLEGDNISTKIGLGRDRDRGGLPDFLKNRDRDRGGLPDFLKNRDRGGSGSPISMQNRYRDEKQIPILTIRISTIPISTINYLDYLDYLDYQLWARGIISWQKSGRVGSRLRSGRPPDFLKNRDQDEKKSWSRFSVEIGTEKKSRSRFSVKIGEASPIDLAHICYTTPK